MTAPSPAADAVAALRDRRATRRSGAIEPFDAFYQAYVTVLLAGAMIVIASSWVGDVPVGAAGRSRLLDDGPALLGLLCAVGLMVGVRSGSRGGPFAIEAPEVHYVLLGPVDHRQALRDPAVRQLRFLAFGSLVVGSVAGQLAARRLPGNPLGWVVAAAAFALATVGLSVAVAWLAGGTRLPQRAATATGVALVGWSVWDLALGGPTAPGTVVGGLALWPLHADGRALAPLLIGAALAVVGLGRLGGISVERVRRRSTLVGHLRFAATMRDVRTVMVLRRQLTQERARQGPWLPTRRRGGRTVVVLRDWRSLMRTPVTRLVRMVALSVVAAVAAFGVWAGTTPLVVVAGLASFLAGLEAVEPLAQEIDHPSIHRLAPVPLGSLVVQHLVVPAATMIVVGGVGLATVAVAGVGPTGVTIGALTLVPAALAGMAGAAVSTIKSMPEDPGEADTALALPPEITGMRLVYQTAWPPAVACLGFLPVLAARGAAGSGLDPSGAAASATVPVMIVVGLVVAWARYREDLRAWTARVAGQATVARDGAERGGRG